MILDQAEKDLGPSLDITLARLDHWVQQGGDEAKAEVAKLAETRRHSRPRTSHASSIGSRRPRFA